jgi:hypothetical protein
MQRPEETHGLAITAIEREDDPHPFTVRQKLVARRDDKGAFGIADSLAVHSVIRPNSGHRDYSRLRGGVEDTRTFSLLPPGVEVRPVLAAPSIKFPVLEKIP